MKISAVTLNDTVCFEVTSKAYYEKLLQHPIYPGLNSGVTIGIGYDLGYNSPAQIYNDWCGLLPVETLNKLVKLSGLKGKMAAAALTKDIKRLAVPWDAANKVFEKSFKKYAAAALKTYPGLDLLEPDAAGTIVGLVYNRGTDLTDDPKDKNQRRKEMAAIKPLILKKDYAGIAAQLRSMKRLWDGIPNYKGADEKRAAGLVEERKKLYA